MKFLDSAKLVLGLIPALFTALKAVEDLLPDGGQGAVKLEAVRGFLQAAYDVASDQVSKFDDAWPALKKAIDVAVALFNKIGVFKKV